MDDATAATALSVPVLTPKSVRITYTTAAASLGVVKAAAFRVSLLGTPVQSSALGPVAAYLDSLLSGPGFDATNADVQSFTPQFIASGLLTQADANLLLNDSVYICNGIVATADVTAARAANTFQSAVDARKIALDAYRDKLYVNFSNPNTTMPAFPA